MKLLQVKTGSTLYGTTTISSDIDVGIVYLEEPSQIFGIEPIPSIPQKQIYDIDLRGHYLKDFIKLCLNGNPNVLEWLYSKPDYIDADFSALIRDNRFHLLQKQKLVDAHLGFAKSQVIRMTKHENEMGAKRRELVTKYGYDVKFAGHALRLIFQLKELLEFGSLHFPLEESKRQILLDIKQGQVSLDKFNSLYEKEIANIDICIERSIISNNTDLYIINKNLEQLYYKKHFNAKK